MSKFCTNCGVACDDQATVCSNCHAPLSQTPPQQPQAQQPQYQQPQYQQPAPAGASSDGLAKASTAIKGNIKWAMIGVAVIALIFFVVYTFGLFTVNASVEAYGQSESQTLDISDVVDTDGFGILILFNVLAGLLCLAATALCIHGFSKNHLNLTFVPFLKDQPNTYPGSTEFLFANAAIALSSLLLILSYWIFGSKSESYGYITAEMSVSAPVISWIFLFLFGGIAAFEFFVLRKFGTAPAVAASRPHQPRPAPQYQATPQPQYQQPQYQQPQYQAPQPQYQAPQPQYQQPQYQPPQYQAPQYQQPQYQQPQYQAPQYQQPQYQPPQYQQPQYQQPQYQPPQQPPQQQQ